MALDSKELTRGWIQYLKNNRVVRGASDPQTGKLTYIRNPTVADLEKYIRTTGEFDEVDNVREVIQYVASRTRPPEPIQKASTPAVAGSTPTAEPPETPAIAGPTPTEPTTPATPAEPTTPGTPSEPRTRTRTPKEKPGANVFGQMVNRISEPGRSSSGGETRPSPHGTYHTANPNNPNRPGPGRRRKTVREDVTETDRDELSEEAIELTFRYLLAARNDAAERTRSGGEAPPERESPEATRERNQQHMRELKQMIRNVMTPQQRKALWRALSEA